jgi:hypothetical protein
MKEKAEPNQNGNLGRQAEERLTDCRSNPVGSIKDEDRDVQKLVPFPLK